MEISQLISGDDGNAEARHASRSMPRGMHAFRANAASAGSFGEAFQTGSRAAIAALTTMIKMDTIREDVFTAAGSENP